MLSTAPMAMPMPAAPEAAVPDRVVRAAAREGSTSAAHASLMLAAHGMGQGLVLLDRAGTILAITAAALRSLRRCREVSLVPACPGAGEAPRLRFLRASQQYRFERAARACLDDPSRGVQALPLAFEAGLPDLILNLSLVDAGATADFADGSDACGAMPAVLLGVLVDRSLEPRLEPRVLKELFGLTDSESRVAEAYLTLDTMKDVARLLDITVNTVKKHLSAVYVKTGCSKQAQLVRLLMSLAELQEADAATPAAAPGRA